MEKRMGGLEGMQWKDYITAITPAAAFVGAVLGIINLVITVNQRRVRLRVRPVQVDGTTDFLIEIVNFSSFPVIISEAGFCLTGGVKPRRSKIARPQLSGGGDWPRRLESREVVSIGFNRREAIRGREKISNVYAVTSCGNAVSGARRDYKRLQKELAA
jgi:hypothetical protein